MKLLFITEVCPFPVYGGERLRIYGLLRIFEDLNINTVAIIGKSENEKFKDYQFEHIDFIEFDFADISPINRWKRAFSRFYKNRSLLKTIENILPVLTPDFIYIDHLFYGQYIKYFKKRGIHVIYGTHNVQSELFLQRPSVSLNHKFSNMLEYLIHLIHEKLYFRKADFIIAVSKKDKRFYDRIKASKRVFLIPNFLVDSEYRVPYLEKDNYIIIPGNFNAYQNSIGLEWFIENVWDKQIWNITKLLVVGLGSKELIEKIKAKFDFDNIEAIGIVDDIKPYIAKAKIAIVPLLHGSGTRLKCIEAMALKTQVISTSKGAEGIDHNSSIIIANAPADFKDTIFSVLNGKVNYTEKAYMIFKEKYSLEANKRIFAQIVGLH